MADILNRCRHVPETEQSTLAIRQKNEANTVRVMMYMFPRQFGLHNVFTSNVDTKTTVQKFQDYTVRDEEISAFLRSNKHAAQNGVAKVPKRLRGDARHLVRRLQILHRRCSYFELVRHYCPSILDTLRNKRRSYNPAASISKTAPSQAGHPNAIEDLAKSRKNTQTQNRTQRPRVFELDPSVPIVDLATPVSHVSAYLQAVLSRIVPDAFFGEGDELAHNKALLGKKVAHFVTLRRFESMNLHEISQGFKASSSTSSSHFPTNLRQTSSLRWLQLPNQGHQKPSLEETRKILDIFHEFLYYLFDSLLIPLIRNTFYVTESNNHRYQVFYFRHDVWRMVSERAMAAIKDGMLEELKVVDVQRAIDSRRLGFSQIRLLPKGTTLRPITNLRRRYPMKHNKKILGPSINAVLTPIYNVLKLEKVGALSRATQKRS